MIHYERVDGTTWPVDTETTHEDSAEWVLRYGTPERREAQRLSVASVVSAYKALTDPDQSLKAAMAKLRSVRQASARSHQRAKSQGYTTSNSEENT